MAVTPALAAKWRPVAVRRAEMRLRAAHPSQAEVSTLVARRDARAAVALRVRRDARAAMAALRVPQDPLASVAVFKSAA